MCLEFTQKNEGIARALLDIKDAKSNSAMIHFSFKKKYGQNPKDFLTNFVDENVMDAINDKFNTYKIASTHSVSVPHDVDKIAKYLLRGSMIKVEDEDRIKFPTYTDSEIFLIKNKRKITSYSTYLSALREIKRTKTTSLRFLSNPSTRWYSNFSTLPNKVGCSGLGDMSYRDCVILDGEEQAYKLDIVRADVTSACKLFGLNIEQYEHYWKLCDEDVKLSEAKRLVLSMMNRRADFNIENGRYVNYEGQPDLNKCVGLIEEMSKPVSHIRSKGIEIKEILQEMSTDECKRTTTRIVNLCKKVAIKITMIHIMEKRFVIMTYSGEGTTVVLMILRCMYIKNKLLKVTSIASSEGKWTPSTEEIKTTTITSQLLSGYTQFKIEQIIKRLVDRKIIKSFLYINDEIIFRTNLPEVEIKSALSSLGISFSLKKK